MGDPALYPDIRLARHMYALQWLPRAIRDDVPLMHLWITINNNMSYTSTRSCLRSFNTMMLTFVGTPGLPIRIFICAV